MIENGDTKSGWTLVTGGAKHLGAAICKRLAQSHSDIVLHYQTSEREASLLAKELQRQGATVELIQGSFSSFELTEDFLKRYKARFYKTKNLINNVGNYHISSIEKTEPATSYALFQTNVHAPILLSQQLLPSIKELHGSIINIGASGIRDGRADSESGIYMATKSALWSVTKSLAKESARFGVSVNMVSPGQLETSISLPRNQTSLPMGRAGTLEEVARLVGFLLEEENHYITGQNIEVAGAIGL